MQVLWSRSVQTRSCRCNSCLHAAISLARRTTTSASKRRLKVGDIFTTCYSAIFATAALADAKIKADRRKQWDLAIEEVKVGLATSKPNAEDGSPDEDIEQSTDKEAVKPNRYSLRDEHLSYEASNRISTSTQQGPSNISGQLYREMEHLLVVHDGFRWDIMSKVNTESLRGKIRVLQLQVLDSHVREAVLSPQDHFTARENTNEDKFSMGGSTEDTKVIPREPRTRLHLDKMQEMVAKLVAGLLINTRTFWIKTGTKWGAESFFDLKERRRLLTDRISTLQDGRTRLPRYLPADWEDIVQERKKLNGSILTILRAGPSKGQNFSSMVAEICYTLLMGNAPPCITTYNIMIIELTRLGRHDLAGVVVDSFFQDSRLRPNEQTTCAIIDHYIAKGDRFGFRRTVRRMRCVDGEDMRVKSRHRNHLYRPDIALWAMTTKVIHRNGLLHQKAMRSAEVFMSLARGALRFMGAREAVTYLKICVKQGHQFNSDVFIEVVNGCLAERNRNAALHLLATLVSQWRQDIWSPNSLESNDCAREYIFLLLKFCDIISSRSLHDMQAYHLLCKKIRVCPSMLRRWLRHVHLEAISSAIERFSQRISALHSTLMELMISGRSRLGIASSLLNQLEHDLQVYGENRLLSDFKQNAFDYLTIRLEQLSLTLTVIKRELLRTIYKWLDTSHRAKYDRFILEHSHLSVHAKLNIALSLRLDPDQAAKHWHKHLNPSKTGMKVR